MQRGTRAVLVLFLVVAAIAIAALMGPAQRYLARLRPPVLPPSRADTGGPESDARANPTAADADPPFGGRRQRHVLSPHETTSASVHGADMSIEYGRPFMRGRVIFGGLVPYEEVWCPGADECTKLTTNRALQLDGLLLKAGAYTLWMQPSDTRWTLIFNGDANAFHTRRDPRDDVGTVVLRREPVDEPVEQLTFSLEQDPSRLNGGRIVMLWERTRVSAPFTVVE